MFRTLASQIPLIAAVLSCAFAWWKGGPAERGGAILIAVTWIGVMLAQAITRQDVPAIPILAADAVLALGFLLLAIRYSSLWLGVMMLLQGVEMSLTAADLGDPDSAPWHGMNVYLLGVNAISYLVLIAIVSGTISAWSRRVRRARLAAEAAAAAAEAEAASPTA